MKRLTILLLVILLGGFTAEAQTGRYFHGGAAKKTEQTPKRTRSSARKSAAKPAAQKSAAKPAAQQPESKPAPVPAPVVQSKPAIDTVSAVKVPVAGIDMMAPKMMSRASLGHVDIPGFKPEVKRHFMPMNRRIDREINKVKVAYQGEVMMGLTASYGTLNTEEADVWTLLTNISAGGTIASVKPYIGYFYRDNRCAGIRLGYQYIHGKLESAGYDLGPSNDASGTLPYIDMQSNSYSCGIFHRTYAGLDQMGRFGLFAEFELSVQSGSSNFAHDEFENRTYANNLQVKLLFNPGMSVYILPNVCATISFGLGGVQYSKVTQKNEFGEKIGERTTSNMRFRLNLAAINLGMTIHLWDRKKP